MRLMPAENTVTNDAAHEVIFLKALHGETKRELAWQCLMVEFGIDFAFNDQYELPDRLPDDMSGVKAVSIDPASWKEYHEGPQGPRLTAFTQRGGVVFRVWGPEQFEVMDENAARGGLDMMIASANLTMDHPRLRRRLQARTFRKLYEELREPYFMNQISGGLEKGRSTVFNEPYSYNILSTMELFDEFDPSFGWQQRLRDVLDRMLQMPIDDMPNLDTTPGMPIFIRMSRRTGDQRYFELARRLVRRVFDTFDRVEGVIVLEPVRDKVLWAECLAHYAPACVAVAEKDLVDYAISAAHTLHKLLYEPSKKLWYHWGVSGRRCPAIWARGQGWALTGLIGMLHHLPADHPERAGLLRYVEEIIDGLHATQSAEGLWHNVMDNPDSRICCRASGMFCYLLAEARRKGWVSPERVDDLLTRAWRGLRGRIWRDKLCTNCCGTGAGATYQHYMSRPMLFYGASTILRAGVSYTLAIETE